MHRRFIALVFVVSICMSGCSIRPMTDDVTGLSSNAIVRKIRCETRDALIDQLVVYLQYQNELALASDLDQRLRSSGYPGNNRVTLKSLLDRIADPLRASETRRLIMMFEGSAIAYNFAFTVSEKNDLNGQVDLIKLITNGTGKMVLGGAFNRSRQNIRTFTVSDRFGDLVLNEEGSYCRNHIDPNNNFIYPITGKINIAKSIHDFIDLSVFGNLAGKEKGPPTLTDTVQFITKISGTATPSIELSPVQKSARIKEAFITAHAERHDQHEVILGFSLPVDASSTKDLPALQQKRLSGGSNRMIVGPFITATGNATEQNAVNAIEQSILRFESPRRFSIPPEGF